MNLPKISVIIPVYKVEEYINRCIKSVVNQTYDNLEIILVDDGSPDNCPAICDKWAEKDSRIKVIHKNNGGLSDARNMGMKIASGELIGFIDSDDWISKEMYQLLYENMKENEKSYELKSQTSDTLVYTRTLDKYCPNHFLIKLEDSKVIVCNLVNDIVKTKYKEIEVSRELLRQEMVDELSVGIKVDSKEELNFILEDLDS